MIIHRNKGMTLLEIMVALVIFALTGSAVMKAATDHLTNVTTLKDLTFATWVANNRLTQLQLEQQWPPENNRSGTQQLAQQDWYWRQTVKETGDRQMRAVDIHVSPANNKERVITVVSTFVTQTGLRQAGQSNDD
ncbi:Type II secretion system protein [Saliniradius amylolyticus]|uniref:Type II secretion system protein I n=1 Tax=Saliniradius amylolyticus TaxID=2183582 RepID=A0A2S2DZ02_9ALTE|nr:type II secretion system minor pseudopilin GspI [Saliniradius amylolyticus]AWL10624.1 Type II secretion system protein [Saliniradius amylolyticus]